MKKQSTENSVVFPHVGDIFSLQDKLIAHYGGLAGFRDEGAARSTFQLPSMQLGDSGGSTQYVYEYPHGMAAAYLFFGSKNHPFLDGNKRTALSSAVVFLCMNGHLLGMRDSSVVEFVVDVASNKISKEGAGREIHLHLKPGARFTYVEAVDYLLYFYDDILKELSNR